MRARMRQRRMFWANKAGWCSLQVSCDVKSASREAVQGLGNFEASCFYCRNDLRRVDWTFATDI